MQNFLLSVAAATALLSTSAAFDAAKADPSPQLIFGVDRAGDAASLEPVQFIFSGRNFCWYDSGWQGPGFYWCGYANRRGLGWGGGDGFNGWHGGHGAVAGGDRSGGRATGAGAAHADDARVAAGHGAAEAGHGGTAHAAAAPAAHGGVAHAATHAPASHGGGDKKPGA